MEREEREGRGRTMRIASGRVEVGHPVDRRGAVARQRTVGDQCKDGGGPAHDR